MMEEFVLKANQEIAKRTGVCTYIIETTAVKGYRKERDASFEVKNGKSRVISLRTQPLGVQAPGDVSAFTESSAGKEFVEYELVKEAAVPTKSEFDSAKNKLQ